MLGVDALLTAAKAGLLATSFKLFKNGSHQRTASAALTWDMVGNPNRMNRLFGLLLPTLASPAQLRLALVRRQHVRKH
ncbi:hypothetical protein [Mesorhizobium sp.]|uniref:hypothetical protein n=1 Tax=Mesorhizobium sp. TaxID=1871066 RepID=UPI0025F1BAA0|nr:hypothetical protein [Mesorhizobium sp.]